MFGSKKNDQTKNTAPEVIHDITVIPDIFYGGNDPDIYTEKESIKKDVLVQKDIDSKTKEPEVIEKKELPPRVAPSRRLPPPPLPPPEVAEGNAPAVNAGAQIVKPAVVSVSPKKNIVLFIIVFIFVVGAIGFGVWYFYLRSPQQNQNIPVVAKPSENTESLQPVPEVSSEVPTSTVETTSTFPEPLIPTSTIQKERSLPVLSLVVSPDSDSDKLSQSEEEIFGTDPEVLDSDSDGYFDGQEVYNLYNPKGIAPMRIIDSGLVAEYINPSFQYRIYYPISWQVSAIDARNNSEVLFNNASGDYVEVKAYAKLPGETFPGWFGRVVNDQVYTDITPFTNRFQVSYNKRSDGLVYYFDTQNTVYILILYSHSDRTNDYPHVVEMMAQSFRPGKVTTVLPDQPLVPVPGAVTTSTVSMSSSSPMSLSSPTTSSAR